MKLLRLTYLLFFSSLLLISCSKKNAPTINNNSTGSAGTYLLFDADQDYNSGKTKSPSLYTSIYYTNLDGSNLTRLTTPPDNYFDYRASFSFDGKEILFIRSDEMDTNRTVNMVDITGNNLKTITKGGEVDYASFSPDGTQVTYAKAPISSAPYNYSLYINNISGNNETQISPSTITYVANIHWAKDGKIYFAANSGSTSGTYSINPDGSNMKFIMPFGDLLSVSPDAKYLLYSTDSGLYYCNTDGTGSKLVLSLDGNSNIGSIGGAGACMTKDDKEIYIFYQTATSGIYKINIDGSDLTQVLPGYYEVPSIF